MDDKEINLNIINIKDMEARLSRKKVKIGIIEKSSFEPMHHMIRIIGVIK